MVVRAEGNGYSLLCVDDGVMVSMPHFNKEMPCDTLRDLQPVAIVGTYPYVFFANAQAGYKTLDDVVTASKAKPVSVNFGTNGVGGIQHLAVERFQRQAQIRLNHIPYKSGNPALQDLVGGQIPTAIVALAAGSPFLSDPRVIPLAMTDTQRTPLRPDLPTARELGYGGFTTLSWLALFAPRTAPAPLVDKINDAVSTVVALDPVQQRTDRNRFDQMAVEPSLHGALAIFELAVAGDRDQHQFAGQAAGAQAARQGKAVHVRQPDVEHGNGWRNSAAIASAAVAEWATRTSWPDTARASAMVAAASMLSSTTRTRAAWPGVDHGTDGGAGLASRPSGNSTRNSQPLPSPALCAVMVPPCMSTMLRAIVRPRPRPRPPVDRAIDSGAWEKGVKIISRTSGLMPVPASATTMLAVDPVPHTRRRRRTRAPATCRGWRVPDRRDAG
jgi:hypothetical protein